MEKQNNNDEKDIRYKYGEEVPLKCFDCDRELNDLKKNIIKMDFKKVTIRFSCPCGWEFDEVYHLLD